MEKNRIRPVKVGNGVRMSYAKQQEVLEMPNLIELQTNSYQWFLDEGLKEVFRDISPISDFGGHLSLEFVDFVLVLAQGVVVIVAGGRIQRGINGGGTGVGNGRGRKSLILIEVIGGVGLQVRIGDGTLMIL